MKNSLILIQNSLLSLLEHHPKRITAVIAALLLGGGGGAFAVASLAPDASLIPMREVLEPVQPLPLQSQVEALDVHSFKLFRSDTTRANDTQSEREEERGQKLKEAGQGRRFCCFG